MYVLALAVQGHTARAYADWEAVRKLCRALYMPVPHMRTAEHTL